jgi:hypothetical protein
MFKKEVTFVFNGLFVSEDREDEGTRKASITNPVTNHSVP